MKHLLGDAIVFLMLLGSGRGQMAAGRQQAPPAGASATTSLQETRPAASESPLNASNKQLALQAQIDRLVAMGTELKDHVDKTNKNILSIKVVRKAEEIEQFAKRMKEQSRK